MAIAVRLVYTGSELTAGAMKRAPEKRAKSVVLSSGNSFLPRPVVMERAARLIKKNRLSQSVLSEDDIARAAWPSAVGKAIAAHTGRLSVVRTTLVVEVEDAIWQKQLYPLTSQILGRLRTVTGSDVIQDIEFRVAIPRRLPQRAGMPDRPTSEAVSSADESDAIRDPVLKRLYRISRKRATA